MTKGDDLYFTQFMKEGDFRGGGVNDLEKN
jgi:hypothetical protein